MATHPKGTSCGALHRQGGELADQLYLGMLGSLIAFLWSVAEYLQIN
ncbi:MAG: hypothetical protein U9N60_11470 [Thermodesulfobacteriota bacterium]|nr:hypothetical protein [Thermodesulfobacteriota bacterium]